MSCRVVIVILLMQIKASALLTVERRLESTWIETGLEGDPLIIEKGVKSLLTAFVSPPAAEGEHRRYYWYFEGGYSNLTITPNIHYIYKDVGPRDIHLRAENQVSSVSSPVLRILVVEKLGSARIAPHDDVHRGEYYTFRIILDRGSNVTYMWDFGDGTKTRFSMKPHTIHRYKDAGVHLLKVTLTTPLNDSVVATSEVFVLEEDGFCKTPAVLKFHPDLAVRREVSQNIAC
ncbi:uncharacterized protein LOC135197694 [Macrobrachium nipponense]|uniref:uncharacterized protein LOC135197694 n=1 Tax=Macrobrachium nipponense TaxID=159736 RepID=UPI0030C7C69F